MSVSGRLSRCSVVQDENLARYMHKTPGTPIKMGSQTTPRKSDRKRSLFQSSSPTNSEDLGLMSPLSSSSYSSTESLQSPQFSPNGQFSTPPRTPTTPKTHATPVRSSPRLSAMKLDVKSSLFPNLKLHTPKSHRTPKTPRTPRRSTVKKSTKEMFNNLKDAEQIMKDLTTPPKSARKVGEPEGFDKNDEGFIAESDSSPCTGQSTPLSSKVDEKEKASPKPTKLGIKPISTDSFYGPVPEPPKARSRLFIDTLDEKDLGSRKRSPSRDSVSSNRSFVSGAVKRRRSSGTFSSGGKSNPSKRHKGPHVGVWHNIKKPKKMKKHVRKAKPLLSPNSRIAKMKESDNEKSIELKPKRLFEEKPRKRVAKKKQLFEQPDGDIIDSFPDHRIKRKKLPSKPLNDKMEVLRLHNDTPDPNKKFMKYGASKRATFTLNDKVKLQISDGVMKLQSPKKRRKLYSGKKDFIDDFNDFDEPNNEIEQNVQNILTRLENDNEISTVQKKQLGSPCKVQVRKITDTQLFDILENPATKINLVEATPTKRITEIHNSPNNKILTNLSTLNLDEFGLKQTDNSLISSETKSGSNESSLGKTGNMISYMTNILCNDDQDNVDAYPLSQAESATDEETENSENDRNKFFSLFYKENWDKANNTMTDITNTKCHSGRKKSLKVPDDQYLLDAGQKSIGIVTCNKCGVMYQAGDFADEATHKNFHNHLPELKFNGWLNERVVGKWQDGRVIMIVSGDNKTWWHKVSKIVDIVDQELGFPEASVTSLHYKTVYFYVDKKAKQIVGCLIAEECKTAYKMFPPLEGIDVDSCSKDPSPCKIGISRIWTALSHRRRGIASRLIECLQRTFLFGEIVPMDLIAFSVPSPSGKLLAQKVTGKLDFLVYGFA